MIVNQTPYPISFEMKTAQALTCRYGEVGRQYKFIADIDLTGLSANVQVIKPDGTFVIEEATVTVTEDEQYIVVEIPLQATVVKGVCRYDINLFQDEDLILYTAEGPLWVDDQLITEDMIESVAEVNGLVFPRDFLTVENLVDIVNYVAAQLLDDESVSTEKTWSSEKISDEIEGHTPDIDVSKEASGNPIEFSDGADAPLVKCTTAIQGNQDLHGYDKPWVGGAGKNKLDTSTVAISGITFTQDNDGYVTANPSNSDARTWSYSASQYKLSLPSGTYKFVAEVKNASTSSSNGIVILNSSDNRIFEDFSSLSSTGVKTGEITLSEDTNIGVMFKIYDGSARFMICKSTESSTYEPYSNICPITAYNQSTISVEDENEVVQQTSTATFSQAIYQGNADFVKGEVTEEWKVVDLGDFNYVLATNFQADTPLIGTGSGYTDCICEQYIMHNVAGSSMVMGDIKIQDRFLQICDTRYNDATAFKSAVTGIKLVYKLSSPTTETITPTNLLIKSLFGYNHIESSTGDMVVEYITQTYEPIAELIDRSSLHEYSTEEHIIGKWIDGKTLYEQTIIFQNVVSLVANTFTDVYDLSTIGVESLVEFTPYTDNIAPFRPFGYFIPDITSANMLRLNIPNTGWYIGGMTIRYTKTS